MSAVTVAVAPAAASGPALDTTPVAQDTDAKWLPVLELSCELSVQLSIPKFHVADFLKLGTGSVISTGWRLTRDVPVRINGILVGWGEFEGSGNRLAVRLTELA